MSLCAVAGEEKRQQPSQRHPLTGFKPADFYPNWPDGDLEPPQAFFDLDAVNEEGHFEAIEDLRQWSLDYADHLNRKKLTRETFARQTGVTASAVRELWRGDGFPTWRVWMLVRKAVPRRPPPPAR